ncbi:MAG: mismatch repair protein MutT [Frankiales bacterium]|nr:mismatch repair protein MutT [Frankiales bacterium]
MPKTSAGLLLWRRRDGEVEVLLAHPGGPLFAKKDDGVWSVPKGEHGPEEEPLEAARREYAEELGLPAPDAPPVPLGAVVLKSGKVVTAWALEADPDLTGFDPGTFELEWPPRSGRTQPFPEVDRVAWFGMAEAAVKLAPRQVPFLSRLPA